LGCRWVIGVGCCARSASVAEVLLGQFPATAAAEPELLAHHFTQAGLTETAIEWWGKAGQRSLERSALIEAVEQLTRALDQIATLPATPVLRREEIKLQVALITPLIHVKGFAAPETRAAAERARLLIEQAEALGEPPDDPLLLFSALFGSWVASHVAFNGDAMRDLGAQFLAVAEKQGATAPLLIAHRLMGISLAWTGNIAEGRVHYDQGVALYDPAKHRPLATRFGQDAGVSILCFRSLALWLLGYHDAALADSERTLKDAREIGQAATLMFALLHASMTHICCGNYATANALLDELVPLADEKGASFWKAYGMSLQGCLLVLTGKASDAVHMMTSALAAWRSTGATMWVPVYLSHLARAYADVGEFDHAWRCIGEAIAAIKTAKERWWEAELNRTGGEIALLSPEPDAAKAEAYFERALAISREQQAKSWELRAAMSMARLWRNQGKRDQARELLAPVYGWFTEGFDTLDLKEANKFLEELA
jgi:predicted ATPase